MQLDLPFLRAEPPAIAPRVEFVRMRRAKRYIIRVLPDGSVRLTIPRGGSRREAESFFERQRRWTERERLRVRALHAPTCWSQGQHVLLRGVPVPLRLEHDRGRCWLTLGSERFPLREEPADLRPAAEACLRTIAHQELIPRLRALASLHGVTPDGITIRNQRSRWGSCSRAGAIALNFRLVQAPASIRDYVIIHELMHLKQQNHSRRFWRLVEAACPAYRAAERWLRTEGRSLF